MMCSRNDALRNGIVVAVAASLPRSFVRAFCQVEMHKLPNKVLVIGGRLYIASVTYSKEHVMSYTVERECMVSHQK